MASLYSSVYDICPIPNRTIGCQDLLRDKAVCLHSGWLRRLSLRNKFKIFAWPQVYVVISQGCVYCYSNEVARKPASAFSLYGYDKVLRAGEITEKEATWSFKLMHVNLAYRTYLFSASSEKEMGVWMAHMKKEMMRANGKLTPPQGDAPRTAADGGPEDYSIYQSHYIYSDSGSAGSITSQDLKDIETSIYEDTSTFVLPSDYTNKKEEDASDDEMDHVVLTRPDLQERPPLAPPVPSRPKKVKEQWNISSASQAVVDSLKNLKVAQTPSRGPDASPSTPKKTIPNQEPDKPAVDRSVKPTLQRDPEAASVKKETDEEAEKREFWTSIFFYGGKDKASEIISAIADDGVYLVRVNDDKTMVLHIYGKQQPRKFQIFRFDGKVALDTDEPHFDSVEDLVFHYYSNPVPRVDLCLQDVYLHHPAYHSIQWS